MAVRITIQPLFAGGTVLPVPYRATLRDESNGTHVSSDVGADRHVVFADVAGDRVYALRIEGDPFATAAMFVSVSGDNVTRQLLCLVAAKHATPELPTYDELPNELREVLERSEELDIKTEKEREVEARKLESRSLGTRTPATARGLTEQILRDPRPGAERWNEFDDEQKAGLLNLFAKMRSVTVTLNGREMTTWSQVIGLSRVFRDRFKGTIQHELEAEVSKGGVFREQKPLLGLSLHEPPDNFSRAGEWKTIEPFGNLQLTFFRSTEDPEAMRVDADIDDAAGVEHNEQVIRNMSRSVLRAVFGRVIPGLPEGTTHPYDIHQLVVHHQKARGDAGGAIRKYEACYTLVVHAAPRIRIKDGPAV